MSSIVRTNFAKDDEGDAAVAMLENVGGILSIPIVIVEVYVEPSENYLCSSAVTEHRYH